MSCDSVVHCKSVISHQIKEATVQTAPFDRKYAAYLMPPKTFMAQRPNSMQPQSSEPGAHI